MTPQSYPERRQRMGALALQSHQRAAGPVHDLRSRRQLCRRGKSAKPKLKAAKPGEFVAVEIRFTNMVDTTVLHVQPSLWGSVVLGWSGPSRHQRCSVAQPGRDHIQVHLLSQLRASTPRTLHGHFLR
jgi:hypothetical protein